VTPSVSVIVPVYNVAPFLEKCLGSLAAQTLPDIEILVVNDGSSDDSQVIIDDFVAEHPGMFKPFFQPNGGLSSARNLGIAHASGEYVGFVDGDDWVQHDMFELLHRKAQDTDADIVVCGYTAVDINTGRRRYHRQGWPSQFGRSVAESPALLSTVIPIVCNKLFRRSLITRSDVRFPVGRLFEDVPFTYSLMAMANKIEKVQRSLYSWARSRAGSITHSFSPRNIEGLETLSLLNDFYQAHGLFDRCEDELLKVNLRHIYTRFVELPHYDGISTKQRYVSASRAHLHRYFPDWRHRLDWLSQRGQPWRIPFLRHALLAKLYALMPRFAHVALDWLSGQRSVLTAFVRRFSVERGIRLRYARHLRRSSVDRSVALFESTGGHETGGSPFWMMKELASRGTHEIYVATVNADKTASILARHGIEARTVLPGSRSYTRLLATAGIVVSDAPLPPYFVKRPDQVYLCTLHGMPVVKVGRAAARGFGDLPRAQGDLVKTDFILFPNDTARERLLRDYMLSAQYGGRSLTMPLPRNEVLLDTAGHAARSELGLSARRVCLYLPSRDVNTDSLDVESYASELEDFLAELDVVLNDSLVVVVRPKVPLGDAFDFSQFAHVFPAPEGWDDHELLGLADCLITDHGSALFDFMSTSREIVLMREPDDDDIAVGLYTMPEETPFSVFRSAGALGGHLVRAEPFVPSVEYLEFARAFASPAMSGAAARVNDVVLDKLELVRSESDGPQAVDIVFIPYLTKKGAAVLRGLLDSGFNRRDVVFVMSGARYRPRAGAYIRELFAEGDIEVSFRVTSDRILLSVSTAMMSWASRRFGWRFKTLDRTYLQEARRLFGTTRIRSAQDFSGYKKFSAMARVIDEHANSKAL